MFDVIGFQYPYFHQVGSLHQVHTNDLLMKCTSTIIMVGLNPNSNFISLWFVSLVYSAVNRTLFAFWFFQWFLIAAAAFAGIVDWWDADQNNSIYVNGSNIRQSYVKFKCFSFWCIEWSIFIPATVKSSVKHFSHFNLTIL